MASRRPVFEDKVIFMATDYAQLTANLCSFYDFTDKEVLFVGAAGRQLLDPSARTKKLIAIDKNVAAIRELQATIAAQGLQDAMQAIAADFVDVSLSCDAVYFEFCLHEMDDPENSLRHARTLAPDIVIFDHSPGSEWIYYGAEEDKVARSAAVMRQFGIRRHQDFLAEQKFPTFADLVAKVSPQGPLAIERVQRFAGSTNIVIPMSYELNLL